jgi:hypothetical protein
MTQVVERRVLRNFGDMFPSALTANQVTELMKEDNAEHMKRQRDDLRARVERTTKMLEVLRRVSPE